MSRTVTAITRAQFTEADREVRAGGYKRRPETLAEVVAYAVRYPDCVPASAPATADSVITGRGRNFGARGRAEWLALADARGIALSPHPWREAAYWANFTPRSACSWRPTAAFCGAQFAPRPLP